MAPLSYRRHRFPPEIIQHAIWLYLLFTLSYRDRNARNRKRLDLERPALQALPARRTTDYEETIVTVTSTSGFTLEKAEARRRRAQGATLKELARSYDVSRSTISRLTAS